MAQKIKNHVVLYNGKKMPIVGIGTFKYPYETLELALNTALEAGYRHIDTAYAYDNEENIGKILKKWFDSKKIRRDELFIVTKLPSFGNRAESVEKYLKRSLAALQLDYVDLYLIHGPVGLYEKGDEATNRMPSGSHKFDMSTDLVKLWKGMEKQVDDGRARSIGLSNFNARQVKKIVKASRIPPANLQVELNACFQQKELVAFCKALDVTVCAYSPLGSPDLPEFIKNMGQDTSTMRFNAPLKDPVIHKIAEKHNKSPAQVLLRHAIQKGIIVIPRSTNPTRIKENIQIFDFELSQDDVDEIDALDLGRKGRVFADVPFPGMNVHPEYPFADPY